jgi:hypothetical protein
MAHLRIKKFIFAIDNQICSYLLTFFCNTVEIVPMNSECVETLVAVVKVGAGFALVPDADDGIHTTPCTLYASVPVANNLQLIQLARPVVLLWKLDFGKVRLPNCAIYACKYFLSRFFLEAITKLTMDNTNTASRDESPSVKWSGNIGPQSHFVSNLQRSLRIVR